MADTPVFLVDGVSSSSTHNGIHRLVLFRLSKDASPKEAVEIAVPDRALKDIIEVLTRIMNGK